MDIRLNPFELTILLQNCNFLAENQKIKSITIVNGNRLNGNRLKLTTEIIKNEANN